MKLAQRLTLIFILLSQVVSAQYLHQDGKYIVDGDGNNFIIRSMGLGGWMLQEGYMLGTGGFAGTQHEIRALIESSMGKERTDEFYDAWLANHCTKADIDSLASWGFNAVRPALHYNLFTLPIEEEPVAGEDTWLETGFQMLDELVEWCKANQMYVILDLHAVPGGQGKNADISDYDPTKPSLWESPENQRKTVALWRKLAERYANEQYVGGYDLINETNWNFNGTNPNGCDSSNAKLRSMMIRLTNAIREVDQNHILFIEGNCWANNMNGLFPAWDDNMAFSFHKYWNGTEKNTITEFLNWRDQYNVPFWLGESGENSNQWFYETISMLESQQIGWSWWPMKKIGSVVGPLTAIQTPEYDQLLQTWKNGGTPDPEFCYQTLMKITENLMIENCEYHPGVIDAMFRQQTETSALPFKQHEIPGTINSVDYDLGRHDVAYHDADYMNTAGNGGAQWNNGWTYRNDGVDIEACEDDSPLSNGYGVGWINAGEWMAYTVNVKQTGAYKVTFRVAGAAGTGKFHLEINGKNITGEVTAAATAGNQSWTDVIVEQVILNEGSCQLRFVADHAGFNINYISFTNPEPTSEVPTKALNGFTSPSGNSIYLAINKKMDTSITPDLSAFSLNVNENIEDFTEITYDSNDASFLLLTPKKKITGSDIVTISYNSELLKSADEQTLASFSNLVINTANISAHPIPGRIEAEDFKTNNGLVLENCTDAGAGFDMGYSDDGDYLDYEVSVVKSGNYKVSYRVASGNSAGGKIDLILINSQNESTLLHTQTVPSTNGWQSWTTITSEATLTEGDYTLRMLVNKREFNLNWIKFEQMNPTGLNDLNEDGSFCNLYPNPASDKLYVEFNNKLGSYKLTILNLQGTSVYSEKTEQKNRTTINTSGLKNGIYLLQISGTNQHACKRFVITN